MPQKKQPPEKPEKPENPTPRPRPGARHGQSGRVSLRGDREKPENPTRNAGFSSPVGFPSKPPERNPTASPQATGHFSGFRVLRVFPTPGPYTREDHDHRSPYVTAAPT